MIQYNEYFQAIADVSRLGFAITNPQHIPKNYLNEGTFIIFRTCHSYGDWVILSAMPRLIKQKYPDCTVIIPSPDCIAKFFSPDSWMNKHKNPFTNVVEVFANNPYVDGMIDDIPAGYPIYHDHFRIYDTNKPDTALIQQMLNFWRFEDHEMQDCEPELYWSEDEQTQGAAIIKTLFGEEEFGFLYIDDTFLYSIDIKEPEIQRRHNLIQAEINNHNLPWLYFSAGDKFRYKTYGDVTNVEDIAMTLRIQNYVKSKAKTIIGFQGGYGTDCMSRYAQCHVVPLHQNSLNEHIQYNTTYLGEDYII